MGVATELWHYPALAAAGVVAGFVNVMAGGGSLLTMPVMIFLGMAPATANGTNRIALLAQNATAIARFHRQGMTDLRRSLTLGLCTLPGAVAGAIAAVRIDPTWFNRLLAVVMIAVLFATLWPRRAEPSQKDGSSTASRGSIVAAHLSMVLVGAYGGFIQAGVGFLFMAIGRRFLALDLVRVNAHKVFVIGLYMIPSLAVFVALGQIEWIAGFTLALGTALGAAIATRLQVERGEGPVRVVFSLAVIAMAIKLAAT